MPGYVGRLVDSRVVVREIETGNGPAWVRVRAASSGDFIEAGGGGALDSAAKKAGKPNEAHAARVTEALCRVCLMGIGETADTIEPVTVTVNDSERAKPGTAALPIYCLSGETVGAVVQLVMEISLSEATRAKAASFPAG